MSTTTGSTFVTAIDWTSYANPQASYTVPAVTSGEVPQTDIAVQWDDNVLPSWDAEDELANSCILSEIGGTRGSLSSVADDAGESAVSLGSIEARVFQLSCTDLNGRTHLLQARIHQSLPASAAAYALNGRAIGEGPAPGVAGTIKLYWTDTHVDPAFLFLRRENHVERAELCQNTLPNGFWSPCSDLLMCATCRLPIPTWRTAQKWTLATSADSGGPAQA